MPSFGSRSELALSTAHPLLVRVMRAAVQDYDCTVLVGHRGKVDQDTAFASGKSKLKWPASKHNVMPSLAVDVVPWPIDWNDIGRFRALAVVVRRCWEAIPASERDGYTLAWGGDWISFRDYPHWELRR